MTDTEDIVERIASFTLGAAAVALVGILVLMVLRIVSRNLGLGLAGLQLYAQALGVWMVFVVAGALGHERRHIEMDYLSRRLPARLESAHEIAVATLNVGMCGVIVVGSVQAMREFWTGTSPSVDIPLPLYYVPAIVGLSLLAAVYARRIGTAFTRLST